MGEKKIDRNKCVNEELRSSSKLSIKTQLLKTERLSCYQLLEKCWRHPLWMTIMIDVVLLGAFGKSLDLDVWMILIAKDLLDRIRQHAAATYPAECCGALFGRSNEGTRHVSDVVPLDNRREREAAGRRYLIPAEVHWSLEKEARQKGVEIVGFYHSHPDHPPIPSKLDEEEALPRYTYLIVAVEDGTPGEVTCWMLPDDRSAFSPVALTISG